MNQELLHIYFKGETTIEEEKRILDWVEASEENRQWFLKERMIFDMALLTDQKQETHKPVMLRILPLLRWSARVAAVVIVAISSLFLFNEHQYNKVAQPQNITVPPGQRAQITLADGTKVWLNAKSTLTYASNFGRSERSVTLNGEAYFEVAKNKDMPFYVNTEKNQVKVIGTTFNICAYNGADEFEATLVEGTVDIYDEGGQRKLTRLTTDEFFSSKNGVLQKKILPSYEYLRWKEGLYCFDDNPFRCILDKLEKYYNIKITVNDPQVLDYRCTGKFRDKDGFEHILRAIQKDHKFTYRINDERDSVVIQ